jgi:hypothetical protein
VLLCRPGKGAALYQRLKVYLQRKGVTLNERKTNATRKGPGMGGIALHRDGLSTVKT